LGRGEAAAMRCWGAVGGRAASWRRLPVASRSRMAEVLRRLLGTHRNAEDGPHLGLVCDRGPGPRVWPPEVAREGLVLGQPDAQVGARVSGVTVSVHDGSPQDRSRPGSWKGADACD